MLFQAKLLALTVDCLLPLDTPLPLWPDTRNRFTWAAQLWTGLTMTNRRPGKTGSTIPRETCSILPVSSLSSRSDIDQWEARIWSRDQSWPIRGHETTRNSLKKSSDLKHRFFYRLLQQEEIWQEVSQDHVFYYFSITIYRTDFFWLSVFKVHWIFKDSLQTRKKQKWKHTILNSQR